MNASAAALSPEDDRWNGWVFVICYAFVYLAAPVLYIGVVQAALFDKLGTNATIANLPSSTYSLGQIAPLFLSWLVPHRLEKKMVVWSNVATATTMLVVLASLLLPAPAIVRIAAVSLQGLLQGLSQSTSFVFMLQCLRRGTTEAGRVLALKRTFGMTPFFAVAGSLGAQYVLSPGFASMPFPYDFALIYAFGIPCAVAIAVASSRFRLPPLEDEPRRPLHEFLRSCFSGFAADRVFLLVWIAYVLWYTSLGITSNLALYTREAMHADPKEYSGIIMAIRFGCKALAGYLIGAAAQRWGLRGGALICTALLAAGSLWAWVVPGAGYLFSFGLLGAGELGGAYIPNYVGALSSPADAPRNLALITLATPASSFAPVAHGMLTDRIGFAASFAFGLVTAIAALALLMKTNARKSAE